MQIFKNNLYSLRNCQENILESHYSFECSDSSEENNNSVTLCSDDIEKCIDAFGKGNFCFKQPRYYKR